MGRHQPPDLALRCLARARQAHCLRAPVHRLFFDQTVLHQPRHQRRHVGALDAESAADITLVNGWCFGGGYGPLFGCDLAFAAEDAKFGLSEINWGILPGGGATKVAVELLSMRDAMYHAMTGEPIDGVKAAAWKLVNEAVPAARLRARVTEVANVLLKKNPVALKATKDAIRRVSEMTYENAEDYLVRAQEAANSYDNEGRKEGIRQFIDEKSFKPDLGTYDVSKQHVKA